MMDCLYAKSTPVITDCVMAELEKLGPRYRIALRIAKDPRFERLKCDHKGTYADDCIVNRVMQNKVYIVATNDVDLKRRIRKIPGVPIMSCGTGKCVSSTDPVVTRQANRKIGTLSSGYQTRRRNKRIRRLLQLYFWSKVGFIWRYCLSISRYRAVTNGFHVMLYILQDNTGFTASFGVEY